MINILILLLIPTFGIAASNSMKDEPISSAIHRSSPPGSSPAIEIADEEVPSIPLPAAAPCLTNESIIRACAILVVYFILDWYFLREKN